MFDAPKGTLTEAQAATLAEDVWLAVSDVLPARSRRTVARKIIEAFRAAGLVRIDAALGLHVAARDGRKVAAEDKAAAAALSPRSASGEIRVDDLLVALGRLAPDTIVLRASDVDGPPRAVKGAKAVAVTPMRGSEDAYRVTTTDGIRAVILE